MTYDFTTLPDRWDTGAEKYELMKKRCPDVPRGTVPFSVADMDFLPPPELSEGVQDFMRGRVFGYTRTPREYIAAFQRWMQRRHGVDIPAAWVVDADSVLGAMHRMIRAFTRPGDGIVVLTPAYPPFLDAPEPLNRRRLDCPMVLGDDRRYTIDFALLEDLCRRADTTMLIFCNPHNPVGRVWSRQELEQVADICLRHGRVPHRRRDPRRPDPAGPQLRVHGVAGGKVPAQLRRVHLLHQDLQHRRHQGRGGGDGGRGAPPGLPRPAGGLRSGHSVLRRLHRRVGAVRGLAG